MLNAMLAACATLIFVLALAVPHAAKARRLARLFRAQREWAELMDCHASPEVNRKNEHLNGRYIEGRRPLDVR